MPQPWLMALRPLQVPYLACYHYRFKSFPRARSQGKHTKRRQQRRSNIYTYGLNPDWIWLNHVNSPLAVRFRSQRSPAIYHGAMSCPPNFWLEKHDRGDRCQGPGERLVLWHVENTSAILVPLKEFWKIPRFVPPQHHKLIWTCPRLKQLLFQFFLKSYTFYIILLSTTSFMGWKVMKNWAWTLALRRPRRCLDLPNGVHHHRRPGHGLPQHRPAKPPLRRALRRGKQRASGLWRRGG